MSVKKTYEPYFYYLYHSIFKRRISGSKYLSNLTLISYTSVLQFNWIKRIVTERRKIRSYKFPDFKSNAISYLYTKSKWKFIWNSYIFPRRWNVMEAQHCNHFLIFNMWYVTLKGMISLPLKMQKSLLCNSKQFWTKTMHHTYILGLFSNTLFPR